MKKTTKTLLALALAAGMMVPAAFSTFAGELVSVDENLSGSALSKEGNTAGGCGFIDSNLFFTTELKVESLADIKVEVNGKAAYHNNGYLGETHCGLRDYDKDSVTVKNGKIWLGVVGADLKADKSNTIKITAGDDTYEGTFESTVNALGTSYAKVTVDEKAKTAKAEIIFNTDPKLAIGTVLKGQTHDEHKTVEKDEAGNITKDERADFKVTAYDSKTGLYTIEADNFETTHSLLELQITSDGTYKGYFVTATINEKTNCKVSDKSVTGTKIELVSATCVKTDGTGFGTAANLIDGFPSPKLEGNFPAGGVTITVEAKEAVKATGLVFYTQDDGDWGNRAPKAFEVYGSNDASQKGTKIYSTEDSKIEGGNNLPYAFQLDTAESYKYYTVVVTNNMNNGGYFQIGELALYTGDVKVVDGAEYVTRASGVAANGTLPGSTEDPGTTPENPGETQKPSETQKPAETQKPGTTTKPNDNKPAQTGDAMVVAVVLAVVALGGVAVVVSKKRSVR